MLLIQLAAVVAFLALWELFSLTPFAQRAQMPGAITSFATMFGLWGTGPYWGAIGGTLGAWAFALLASIVIGVPLGLIIGRSGIVYTSTHFVVDFLRTLPALALVPLGLLLFGPTHFMAIALAFFASVWPLLIQSVYAGKNADPMLHRMARSFRLRTRDRILYVLVPDALAFIWPGLRLATTAALLVTIAAEMIGLVTGSIGDAIAQSQLDTSPPDLFAYVLTSCFLGLGINAVLGLVQSRVLWWHPAFRGRA